MKSIKCLSGHGSSKQSLKCLWQEPQGTSTPHWVELGCVFSTSANLHHVSHLCLAAAPPPLYKSQVFLQLVSRSAGLCHKQNANGSCLSESLQIFFLGFKSVSFEFYLSGFWLWKGWRAWKLLYTCALLRIYIPASELLNSHWRNHKWTKL